MNNISWVLSSCCSIFTPCLDSIAKKLDECCGVETFPLADFVEMEIDSKNKEKVLADEGSGYAQYIMGIRCIHKAYNINPDYGLSQTNRISKYTNLSDAQWQEPKDLEQNLKLGIHYLQMASVNPSYSFRQQALRIFEVYKNKSKEDVCKEANEGFKAELAHLNLTTISHYVQIHEESKQE